MLIRALYPILFLLGPDEGAGGGGEGGASDAGKGGGGEGGSSADAGNGSGNGGSTTTTFTQDQVNALLAREKGKLTSRYSDYDDLKKAADKLKEIETASQSDIERVSGERDTLKGQNGSLSNQNLRLKVALKKGLTGDKAVLADRLTGSTEAELEADADELLKLLGNGGGTGFDGGARGGSKDQPQSMDALIRRSAGRAAA